MKSHAAIYGIYDFKGILVVRGCARLIMSKDWKYIVDELLSNGQWNLEHFEDESQELLALFFFKVNFDNWKHF